MRELDDPNNFFLLNSYFLLLTLPHVRTQQMVDHQTQEGGC